MTEVDQYEANRRLLFSVIGLALKDACIGSKSKDLHGHAVSAFDFLFKYSDGYLELLDLDVQRFREYLLDYVDEPRTRDSAPIGDRALPYNLTDYECRNFRRNYKKWLALPASYGRDMWLEEEDEDENNS